MRFPRRADERFLRKRTRTGVKVLALVPAIHDTSPGQRFRIEQWEPWLRAAGVHVEYEPFETPRLHEVLYERGRGASKARHVLHRLASRLARAATLRSFDAAYIFRESALLGPALVERLLRRRGIPYVFDFDDAVFLPNASEANARFARLKCPGKTAASCRHAAHVIAGNDYLAAYARAHNPRVTVVPTTIDTARYTSGPARQNDRLVIGWTGSRTTARYLEELGPVLTRLARERRFTVRIVGATDVRIDGVDVEALPWRSRTEIDDLRAIDIGLMPLPDDEWTCGKCGLKALQYMALGIPAVCSPVGVNAQIITDGENGLLARSPDEWTAKLSQLLSSAELRGRLGARGRETVEQRYAAALHAPRVARILRAAASGLRPEASGLRP
jgi:glycosyltransferase involved in cell wall biosynthesis